jgi:hypothetical protein
MQELIQLDLTGLAARLDALAAVDSEHRTALDALASRVSALEPPPPPPASGVPAGMRGMWLQNTSDPTTARNRVRHAAGLGANTVYWFAGVGANVRFRNSQGIPVTEVLDDVCDEAAKAGVVVYAALPAKYFTRSSHPNQNLRGRVPGVNEDWLDFRSAAARDLMAGLARDAAEGYGVNIILDYCRYHRDWFPGLRDQGVLSANDITEMVRVVYQALPSGTLMAMSPMGRLDVSPYSAANNAQDWPAWLDQGIVDWLSPMCYHDEPFLQTRIAEWRATGFYPERICPLLSIERALQPPEEKTAAGWRAEIRASYASGARGLAVFDENLANRYPSLASVLHDEWRTS